MLSPSTTRALSLMFSSSLVRPNTFPRTFVTTRIVACDQPADQPAERRVGTVKWFNTQKGFGFIMPSDGSPDLFVHQTAIYAPGFRSLEEGEPVEFEVRARVRARGRRGGEVPGPSPTPALLGRPRAGRGGARRPPSCAIGDGAGRGIRARRTAHLWGRRRRLLTSWVVMGNRPRTGPGGTGPLPAPHPPYERHRACMY